MSYRPFRAMLIAFCGTVIKRAVLWPLLVVLGIAWVGMWAAAGCFFASHTTWGIAFAGTLVVGALVNHLAWEELETQLLTVLSTIGVLSLSYRHLYPPAHASVELLKMCEQAAMLSFAAPGAVLGINLIGVGLRCLCYWEEKRTRREALPEC